MKFPLSYLDELNSNRFFKSNINLPGDRRVKRDRSIMRFRESEGEGEFECIVRETEN